jgi:hypothetical protein
MLYNKYKKYQARNARRGRPAGSRPGLRETEVAMFEEKTRVLLILSRDVVDRARVFAGKATTALKLPISLQIVLRALIEEGLKREDHPGLLANVEGQAKAVRHKRTLVRRAGLEREPSSLQPGPSREPKSRGSYRRRK